MAAAPSGKRSHIDFVAEQTELLRNQSGLMQEIWTGTQAKRARQDQVESEASKAAAAATLVQRHLRSIQEAEQEADWRRVVTHAGSAMEVQPERIDEVPIKMIRIKGLIELGKFHQAIAQLNDILEQDPTNSTAHFYRGFAYQQLLCKDRAIADFEEALESLSCRQVSQVFLAFESGRFDEVIERTDRSNLFVQEGRTHGIMVVLSLCLMRSIACAEKGRYDEALSAVKYGLEHIGHLRSGNGFAARFKLCKALILRAQNKEEEASAVLNEIRSQYYPSFPEDFARPNHPLANAMRNLLNPDQDSRRGALRALTENFTRDLEGRPSNQDAANELYGFDLDQPWPEAEFQRAMIWIQADGFEAAATLLRSLVSTHQHPARQEAAYQLGMLIFQEKVVSDSPLYDAWELFSTAAASDHPGALIELAKMYLEGKVHPDGVLCLGQPRQENLAQAIEHLEKAYTIAPSEELVSLLAELYYSGKGAITPNYERAFVLFQEAESMGCRSEGLYERLATMCYHGQGLPKRNLQDALRYAQLWRRQAEHSAKASLYMGMLRGFSSEVEKKPQAIHHLKHASLDGNKQALGLLKNVYRWVGHPEEATWDDPEEPLFDRSYFPSLSASSTGQIALSYLDKSGQGFCKVGQIDPETHLRWDTTLSLGEGQSANSVALNNQGLMALFKREGENFFFTSKRLTAAPLPEATTFEWVPFSDQANPDIEKPLSVAMSKRHIVVVHETRDKTMVSRVGQISRFSITFREGSRLVAGVDYRVPAVGLQGKTVVLVVERVVDDSLAYRVGQISGSRLNWKSDFSPIPGSKHFENPAITMTGRGEVTCVANSWAGSLCKKTGTIGRDGGIEWSGSWVSYDLGTMPSVAYTKGKLVEMHAFAFSEETPMLARGK